MDTANNVVVASANKTPSTVKHGNATAGLPGNWGHTDGKVIVYLRGFRFAMLATLISIMIFIVGAETNITVTSVVTITRGLGGFERNS
ncbi:Uu.00g027420.m01.CDS01 [Anthostomella pinea]|uniref:Uu.00g027420.m01.CDS01 n=1 Tax=Anthostomella pinea TaxID=933095 RepID=A0AAI8YAA3_9PEZI|nr:Uu.00g027420.m01.CDS01 [Anthostomella pinea]